jgi:hypothetical protein
MNRRYIKKELAVIEDEKAYWDEFANLIGWPLTGWNRKSYASFRNPPYTRTQQITGEFRDAIMQAKIGGKR